MTYEDVRAKYIEYIGKSDISSNLSAELLSDILTRHTICHCVTTKLLDVEYSTEIQIYSFDMMNIDDDNCGTTIWFDNLDYFIEQSLKLWSNNNHIFVPTINNFPWSNKCRTLYGSYRYEDDDKYYHNITYRNNLYIDISSFYNSDDIDPELWAEQLSAGLYTPEQVLYYYSHMISSN